MVWREDISLVGIPVIAMSTSMALFAVAVSSKTSRGDQLLSSAMVVVIEFGVAGSGRCVPPQNVHIPPLLCLCECA